MIQIWRFSDAPERYRVLSQHGGDEDWIMVVPFDLDSLVDQLATAIGVCDTSRIELPEERQVVYIGAHA